MEVTMGDTKSVKIKETELPEEELDRGMPGTYYRYHPYFLYHWRRYLLTELAERPGVRAARALSSRWYLIARRVYDWEKLS